MDYIELKQIFQELKRRSPKEDLTAHIVFTADSFTEVYPRLSRTYRFDSDNKAFWPGMGGYSIFGSRLDGTDQGVRLDWYMAEEGNPGGWKVEECYILEHMRDAAMIFGSTRVELGYGMVDHFFGDTCIRVREDKKDGKLRLEPLSGMQSISGKWTELPVDRVYGYCTLLERHLNSKPNET